MKQAFLIVICALACCLFFACGQDGMNPTANDMKAMSTSNSQMNTRTAPPTRFTQGEEHHVTAELVPVNGSGITGHVTVDQLPHGGVNISVTAFGLNPDEEYLSLYYENHTCQVEPYEEDDVIGTYSGNPSGEGHTQNKLGDDLDEVNSVSVRRASDFTLLSCADIHP